MHFDIGTFGDHITGKTTLWTLSLIGLFIVMACINFMNLSTAQAVGQSKKKWGYAKYFDSNRSQLFWQVIGRKQPL